VLSETVCVRRRCPDHASLNGIACIASKTS